MRAGLVFCHRNAPIKNIINLAHQLGDLAKKATGSAQHRIAYEVLESFDDVTGDLEAHRLRWLPKGEPAEKLLLDPTKSAVTLEICAPDCRVHRFSHASALYAREGVAERTTVRNRTVSACLSAAPARRLNRFTTV